jgi:Flp pilus assembly protein TadG
MIVSARAGIHRRARRRGTIVSLLALTLVGLMAFLALAIDLGMLSIAKTQAQQAADLAALTAARTLNGDSTENYNSSAATTNAQNIMTYNYILGQPVRPAHQMAVTYGSYDYSSTAQSFSTHFPASNGVPYTAVHATVTTTSLPGAFSTVLGAQFLPNVTAIAEAVHRPRDIGLSMDLSSSMRYGTLLGFDMVQNRRTTNNPDTLMPTFGQYSSTNASILGPSSDRTSAYNSYTVTPSNTTIGNSSYTLTYINGFYQNDAFATNLVRAFDSYTSSDGGKTWSASGSGASPSLPPASYAATPGGDVPLYISGSTSTYASTLSGALGSSSANALWELDGYSAYRGGKLDTSGSGGVPAVWTRTGYGASSVQFHGYTQGPGYWGKTFFIWPPDPRNTNTLSGSTLTSFLNALGVTNAADQAYLASMWSGWQAQGTTGLTSLKNWLKGNSTSGGPYTTGGSGPFVPGSGSKAPTYYAVCRLFNRAYPAGRASPNGSFSADWRMRFFGTNDNTKLFNTVTGSMNRPSVGNSTYTVNYAEILKWLQQSPNPFPKQMRAGRIKYYGAIPTSINGSYPDYGGTDERFWVEVIDHMLGFRQTNSQVSSDVSAMTGYGGDFAWGSKAINSPPSNSVSASVPQYMSYSDNPARPLLRYWFSPILMVDYLHNYNLYQNIGNYFTMQPGDSYEAPIYTAREAFQASIATMKANHPNDYFTLVAYSRPRSSSRDNQNRFNCVRCPLGINYDYATASLFFPSSTLNADGSSNGNEITPYDADPSTGSVPSADFSDTPRAKGGTCFAMALMLCYNQFAVTPTSDDTLRNYVSSSGITFPTGMAGGMGRRGAQKVVIFETDGIPETRATANLVNGGGYSYYAVRYDMNRPGTSEYPNVVETTDADPVVTTQIYSLIDQMNTTYGTTRNPFKLYAIGFGPVFDGPDASLAKSVLQTMQFHGNTQSNASTALPSYQIITGTDAQMSANLVSAYTNILQNGVQIALTK